MEIVQIDDPNSGFYARAKAGTLPMFSYIEPKWGGGLSYDSSKQGNDYHPPTDVCPGEKLLYDIYTALRSNPSSWNKTLLIVTFDEHGGTYDHHAPAWGATNPGDPDSLNSSFNFHLYGVRVPALLISPYVPPGTVFREPLNSPFPYDHTSILATLLKWQGIDPLHASLWNRVSVAPTFEGVLSTKPVNPGINLTSPSCSTDFNTPGNKILEGLPAGVALSIARSSRNLEGMSRRAEDYRRVHGVDRR
jgi:phospholipase C